ncbi:hypothetical protein MIMGU_mgv1a022034mg [Erythranthe guttata]|uniref:Uncharacterized protein n=2 Tax=Erythranthe guttata TaxID=4155 RepID=A0A022R7M2_ERYGU|nr:PREDICTED: uncharacterized protein LOC105958894 isoform X1 [Erythranthe guttata]EYU36251.1 hypothetical protein MIMGU_mgv1a022034mg [Erythranthe guttata]|eukprot:XP_012838351.1 PREDICTED: uncharacterized protein LOC105958894 isoform X1 [Erythranthe guttata]
MGEMDSLWGYAEPEEMEQELLLTRLELQKIKAEAAAEMETSNKHVNHLINMLKFAIDERDEARSQVHKLLLNNKAAFGCSFPNTSPHFHGETPLGGGGGAAKPGKANSSITESNSPSETTYNYQSPPVVVDSLFENGAVSSPEFSNNSAQFFAGSGSVQKTDPGMDLIDSLVKGRALPEKGKFFQAVKEAGPLLQNILVAGPLPKWRNPPQLQTFQIPPVPINGGDDVFGQKLPPPNVAYYAQKPAAATVFSSGNLGFGNCLSNGGGGSSSSSPMMMSYGGFNNGYIPLVKRQRFC